MKVATSIVIGRTANPNLATQAVMQAMHKADITIANSVLLLLSSEFANNPQPAIRAASKAGNCTQVFGCSAAGIFTEDDWVLDAPAAAAMVFSGDVGIQLAKSDIAQRAQQALLTLTAPNAINSTWLNDGHDRYGGVSGDVVGQGPFSVWQNSKGESSGRVEAVFSGVKLASSASHGLKILTKPKKIQSTETFDITLLDNKPPFFNLQKAWEADCKGKITAKDATLPLHLMMAVYANSAEAIMTGEFSQTHLISYDEALGSVTLAQALQPGQFLCWGIRDSETAQKDLRQTTQTLLANLDAKPDFGLLFSCIGRGPFYDGIDHDLNVITAALPKMPLLGFYGNGEIARIGEHNQLLPYSAVLSLFAALQTK